MDAADVARRMRRERELWVELAPGKRLKLRRPLVDEARVAGVMTVESACECLIDWEGIVESDAFPSSGGTAALDFDLVVATNMVRDNVAWALMCMEALSKALVERVNFTKAAEKNSLPS